MSIPRNLLQAIEEFYKRALRSYNLIKLAQYGTHYMPDDEDEPGTEEAEPAVANPPHFDELMSISHQVDDPGLAQQLSILAELYKRAIQIGGGFTTIVRAINNLKDMYSDGEDSDIESILNGMVAEMSRQARATGGLGKPDNPRFVQQLQQLKQDIELRDRDKQTEAEDSYQEDMNVPGAQSEGESDLTGAGLGAGEGESVFDPTAGIGSDKGDKVNRGWHTTGKAGVYKNWAEYYRNEKEAYQADLAIETNAATRKTLQELIEKVSELSAKTEAAINLKNQLKVADDPTQQAQLDKLITELTKLKKERTNLKNKIRFEQIAKEKQRLEAEINKTRDPKERMLLEQKKALQELSLNSNVGKAAERNARLALISAMSGGNFPGDQTLKDMLAKIDEASKAQQARKDFIKKYWEKTVKERGEKAKNEKGEYVRGKYEKLQGVVNFYGTNINTQQREIKRKLYPPIKNKIHAGLSEEENTIFKPYIDAINAARKDNNKELVLQKIQELNLLINKRANANPYIRVYTKYNEKFQELKNYDILLLDIVNPEKSPNLETINLAIDQGKKIKADLEREIKSNETWTPYRPLLRDINLIIDKLEKREI
jgi:hypothetical protein